MNVPTSVKRIVFGAAAALALTASAVAPALADNTVTQQITSAGNLTAAISDASMQSIQYSNTQVTTTGSLGMAVSDPRGSAAGWNVTVASSAFVYGGSSPIGQNIPSANFSITAPADPVYVSGQPIQSTGPVKVAGGSLNTAREVLEAASGTGSGQYTQALPVSLVVPAYSQAGTYTATLTVTITSGP